MSKTLLAREYRSILCGQQLGYGMSRVVYENKLDPTTVVKVETAARRFQNVKEWETWQEFQYGLGKFLAPCVAISACGLILIQKRVEPLRKSEAPEKMPAFLTDFKLSNYGLYENRVVCCDYGTNLAISTGTSARMTNVERRGGWSE